MMEWLESIDRSIVLTVNSWNSPFMDEFMWIVSAKLTWIPLYIILFTLCYRKFGLKTSIIFLLVGIVTVAITDQLSNHLFKDLIQRYRPSHHSLLTNKLHFYDLGGGDLYKGGMYGFISSHASNFFGVCVFAILVLRSKVKSITPILLLIAILVCFSRIYLGVHYLSDIFAGALFGTIVAWLCHRFLFLNIVKKTKS